MKYIIFVEPNEMNVLTRTEKKSFNRKLTDDQVLIVHQKHINGISIVDLAKEAGVTRHTLRKRFIIQELSYKKIQAGSTTNHLFFRNIDSEIKAYLLGFIAGDGSLSHMAKSVISVDIQDRDIKVIDWLREFISTDSNKIHIKPQTIKHSPRTKFQVSSSVLCQDLIKLGVIPNKSKYPFILNDVPLKFRKDVIRGFLDADGCIYRYKDSARVIIHIVCTSLPLLLQFQKWFNDVNIYSTVVNVKSGKITPLWQLGIYSKQGVLDTKEYLYKEANYYLDRKFKKFCSDNTELTNSLISVSSVTTTG